MNGLTKKGREGTQKVSHFGKQHKRHKNILKEMNEFNSKEHSLEEKKKFDRYIKAKLKRFNIIL